MLEWHVHYFLKTETCLTNCHWRTFGVIASVTNMEFQIYPCSSIAVVVKNLNCIIVYSDILKYKNVTQDNCLLNEIFCELFILKFRLKQANISLRLQYFLVATVQTLPDLRTTVPFVTADPEIFHCTHHPVIPDSDFYFPFCSIFNALSKKASK